MDKLSLYKVITYFISLVWLVNGLFCKVLNGVPRHQLIVARILGNKNARPMTIAIGLGETLMAVWILSGLQPGLNAILQIILVIVMNTLEFFLAPDLLLWGRLNAIFAFLFALLIGVNEFWVHQ